MTDLTALPSDITPEDFFMDALVDVLSEVDIPDGLGTERLQFNVVGEEGIELHMGIDEDGDLTLEEGQAEAPPMALTVSTDHFLSLISGDMRDRVLAQTGHFEIGPRELRHAFLPAEKVQGIKALSGDIQMRVEDPETGEETVVTLTIGGHQPNTNAPSCTVRIGIPTILDIVSKKQNPQQLFMTGQIRVEGDMGIVLGVMGVLQSR